MSLATHMNDCKIFFPFRECLQSAMEVMLQWSRWTRGANLHWRAKLCKKDTLPAQLRESRYSVELHAGWRWRSRPTCEFPRACGTLPACDHPKRARLLHRDCRDQMRTEVWDCLLRVRHAFARQVYCLVARTESPARPTLVPKRAHARNSAD